MFHGLNSYLAQSLALPWTRFLEYDQGTIILSVPLDLIHDIFWLLGGSGLSYPPKCYFTLSYKSYPQPHLGVIWPSFCLCTVINPIVLAYLPTLVSIRHTWPGCSVITQACCLSVFPSIHMYAIPFITTLQCHVWIVLVVNILFIDLFIWLNCQRYAENALIDVKWDNFLLFQV